MHLTIHHAFISFQNAAERRRQLAAEIGELEREPIKMLAAAGWFEVTLARRTSAAPPPSGNQSHNLRPRHEPRPRSRGVGPRRRDHVGFRSPAPTSNV